MAFEQYRGRCVGRLMRFCYKLTHHSDSWKFGYKDDVGTIYNSNESEVVATYSWEDDTDIPVFKWSPKYEIFGTSFSHLRNEIIEYDTKYGKGIWSQKTEDEKIKEGNRKRRINLWKSYYEEFVCPVSSLTLDEWFDGYEKSNCAKWFKDGACGCGCTDGRSESVSSK